MADSYSVVAKLSADVGNYTKGMSTAMKSLKGLEKDYKQAGEVIKNFENKAGNAMKAAGKTIATASKIVGAALGAFGVYGIKSAADLRVVEAQYEQAFSGVSGEAGSMVDTMSKAFNMLPERLKAPMSSFQSYFKGTGMEVNKSLSATEKAMTLAADSSAYYDKSIEDTSASLKGMLMGNYENGDAIGINTNATKIAAGYNKKYGGSFEDLNEAQKQNYILEYVEDIQKLNGVMGQSEREGKSFENVFSNLKSSLSTFAAKVMEPFMDPLINAMQSAGEWMSTADEKFFAFMETIQNSTAFQSLQTVIQSAIDKVKEFGASETWSAIQTAFSNLGQSILDIDFVSIVEGLGEFLDKWGPLIAGVVAGVAAFKAIHTVIDTAKASIALFNAVILLMTTPIGLVAIAIGLLVAAGIVLWKNWDTIKAKAIELKDKLVADFTELKDMVVGAIDTLKTSALEDFNELKTLGTETVTTLKDAAIADFNELKTLGSEAISKLKTAANDDFNELKTGGSNALETLKTAAVSDANELKTGASNAFNTLKNAAISDFNELKNGASSKFSEIKNTISSKVQEAKNAASSKFQEMVNAVGDKMNAAVDKVRDIGGGIKDFFDGIDLYASGKAIIQSAINGLSAMKSKITGKVEEIVGAVRDFWPFSPAKTGPLSDIHRMDFAGPIGTSIERAEKPIRKSMASLANIARSEFNPNLSMPNISSNINGSINGSMNHTFAENVNVNNDSLITALNALANKQSDIYLDGNVLVGSTIDKIDHELGWRARRGEIWGR